MPTFNASRSACWSAAGSVTTRTSGSMNSGRFGFVRVPGTNRPARTFAPTFFAKRRAGFAVLTGRDPEDVLRLEPREELRRLPNPGVGLLDVQDVEAVDPHFVDERLHVGAFLLRADVHAGRQVDILGDEQSLHARLLFFLHHAPAWSWSSIRMSSFSFAIRSPPTAPVLMPRHPNATARWAIVSSVVSPER